MTASRRLAAEGGQTTSKSGGTVRRAAFLAVAFFAINFGLSCGQARADTSIRGHFTERHYRMEGEGGAIVWDWDFTLTLSGKNSIHEQWSGHNQKNLQRTNTHDYSLGESAGSVEWRVLGANRLQKTVNFKQHTLTLTITTSGKECHLDVAFRLKPGFKDMYAPRADTGEWTHFSLPQTIQTSCTIE